MPPLQVESVAHLCGGFFVPEQAREGLSVRRIDGTRRKFTLQMRNFAEAALIWINHAHQKCCETVSNHLCWEWG